MLHEVTALTAKFYGVDEQECRVNVAYDAREIDKALPFLQRLGFGALAEQAKGGFRYDRRGQPLEAILSNEVSEEIKRILSQRHFHLWCPRKDAYAWAVSRDGGFYVRPGAVLSRYVAPSVRGLIDPERRRLLVSGLATLETETGRIETIRECWFHSRSLAAKVICGYSECGQLWRPVCVPA